MSRLDHTLNHELLLRIIGHGIADPRILLLIKRWLRVGILESGDWYETDRGTPQGAGISPLLADIFLHYVLDLWVQRWRRGRRFFTLAGLRGEKRRIH